MSYRVQNATSSQIAVEGEMLGPGEYKVIANRTLDIDRLVAMNYLTIEHQAAADTDWANVLDESGTALVVTADDLTTIATNSGTIAGDTTSMASDLATVATLADALSGGTDSLATRGYLPATATGTVEDGTPVVISMVGVAFPRNIWVNPTAATVSVEVSEDGGASYTDWPLGDVTSASSDIRYDPCSSIRFTRVSGTSFTYGIE